MTGKCQKLVCNKCDKKICALYIKALKQALECKPIPEKVHRVIEYNQEVQLKTNLKMNTEQRKKDENDLEKDFVKLMNNSVF